MLPIDFHPLHFTAAVASFTEVCMAKIVRVWYAQTTAPHLLCLTGSTQQAPGWASPGSEARLSEALPRLQGARAAGRSASAAGGTLGVEGSLSERRNPHPSIPEHPTASLPARVGEAERGRAGGRSGVTPFTRDGVRQSRRRSGQPVQGGGPAGLLPGTGLRGRALTLRIWRDRRPGGALKARALGKRGMREPGRRGCGITHLGPQLRACRVNLRAPENPGLLKSAQAVGLGRNQ